MVNQIVAGEGKVFRRISDGFIYDKIVNLGYTFFINGIKLSEPHLETPEDFEQIDEPVREERAHGGER